MVKLTKEHWIEGVGFEVFIPDPNESKDTMTSMFGRTFTDGHIQGMQQQLINWTSDPLAGHYYLNLEVLW